MKIGDLIKEKDYDCIAIHVTLPEHCGEGNILFGCCKSKNGELISLDGDIYSKEEVVLSYEEWENKTIGIENGLDVVIKAE